MNPAVKSVDAKIRLWDIARITGEAEPANQHAQAVLNHVLRDAAWRELWDEHILRGVRRLLSFCPPAEDIYGSDLRELEAHIERVVAINDLFFQIICFRDVDAVIEAMATLAQLSTEVAERLRASSLKDILAARAEKASVKIRQVLDLLAEELSSDGQPWLSDAHRCLNAFCDREGSGNVNALVVLEGCDEGVVLPVHAILHDGTGSIEVLDTATGEFVAAVKRARHAMATDRFIADSQDVILTAEFSDASYSGASIALGAAVAMFSSRAELPVDPYTAFTGDINLDDNTWHVRSVTGIAAKLRAAAHAGSRRAFIPSENEGDIPDDLRGVLDIVPVSSILEVITCLQIPAVSSGAETLQLKKVRVLRNGCEERGWQLSEPTMVEHGCQFTISPLRPPELKVSIYNTGAHSPKHHQQSDLAELVQLLNQVDEEQVPLQSVNRTFILKAAELRKQVRRELTQLDPEAAREEPHCEYALVLDEPPEKLTIKQYDSGKLTVQGKAGALYRRVLDVIVTLYKVHHPNAELSLEEFLAAPPQPSGGRSQLVASPDEIPYPHIGTDESGKGDYFGPLVVAAVWLDEDGAERLASIGVQDSKSLSDRRCQEIAKTIRETCPGSYKEVEILPERYNTLYGEFKKEQKTLNHLLAWGHARALESLLQRRQSDYAIADQFGDEAYIRSKLMERGKKLKLVQMPKAEQHVAVAAASVLARDRFLVRLQEASRELGIDLPKGASQAVVDAARGIVARHGSESLKRYAKLHFKTTRKALE